MADVGSRMIPNIETKLAIVGLSNAGKSSIIKVLTQEFDMITALRPTQAVERTIIEILGRELIIWDFGGQDIYRNKYLSAPDKYFNNIAYVFYILDIQDSATIDEGIKYFLAVLENLKIYSPDAKIIVLFHKNDPTLEIMLDKYNLKQKFLDSIANAVQDKKIPIILYKTSIYNHLSVITAFSQPFLIQGDEYQNISNMLFSFVNNYNLGLAILFTKNYFELGNAISRRVNITDRDALLKELFKEYDPSKEEISFFDTSEIFKFNILIAKFEMPLGDKKLPFYLTIFYDEKAMLEQEELKIAMRKMNENLQKALINMDLFSLDQKISEKTNRT